ncbi:TMEM165/GDT1 family protein [Smaragdicoccus niigatensis]|uniref:TMEM165/GDT1 family protein n=1 Tax=Smaragdicoccus niigatensis TaxID=359359 RepID=UPI00037E3CBF|nr:TMEM165/GDT1 family protein [Smaragdicoccus niigatensis]
MITAIALSFAIVFVAELGDKSQLMALSFSMRYSWRQVLAGITVAAAIVHALSTVIGQAVGSAFPMTAVAIVSGLAFIGFGLWTLRGTEDAAGAIAAKTGFATVAMTFLLAELGDKTMLATFTLATHGNGVGVWLGSTVGMVAADALAVAIGLTLGRRIPQRTMTVASAGIFVLIGAFAAMNAASGSILLAGAVALTASGVVVAVGRRAPRVHIPAVAPDRIPVAA